MAAFQSPGVRRMEKRLFRGAERDVYFYDVGPHTIWGATARILKNLLGDPRRAARLGGGRAGMTLYPVVMAGGSGTRFWPLSRKARPKQFLALATRKPLVVETVARLGSLAVPGRTYVVCGPVHARGIRRLLPRLPAANVVVEPVARNTAPAIGLATLHVQARDPDGILAVLPSDHHVADVPGFQRVLRRAAEVAPVGSTGDRRHPAHPSRDRVRLRAAG